MPSAAATPPSVGPSHDWTPNSNPRIIVAAPTEHNRPITMPTAAKRPASPKMS